MNCSNHQEREAIGMCIGCSKLICEECAVKIDNKYYCKNCISDMYSKNKNNIRMEQVKDYTDKVVNTTVEVGNNILNLAKESSEREEVKNAVVKIKDNYKVVNYILGVIAIVLLLPKAINVLEQMPYIFEEIIFSFRYYGVIRGLFYIINIITSLIQPLIVIALAVLMFNNFMNLKRKVRIIAPIVVVGVFTLVRFISANIAFSYSSFHIIADLFSYIIPVALIAIGSYIDVE